jgi:hypothetical protein
MHRDRNRRVKEGHLGGAAQVSLEHRGPDLAAAALTAVPAEVLAAILAVVLHCKSSWIKGIFRGKYHPVIYTDTLS